MWKHIPLVASIVLLFGSAAALAQERSGMATLNMAIQSRWVQFNLVAGRINLEGTRMGPSEFGANTAQRKDHLIIRLENGEPAMTYDWLNAKEQFTIDASGDCCVHLRFVPEDDPQGTIVEFVQKPRGKSILTLGTEDKQKICAADSLWHLFLLYPEPARKHLAPLVQRLQPKWKLTETAETIEKELVAHADVSAASDRANWACWVAQLGNESFARREAADRALRAADPALLVYLQQLDFNELDAEQQFRIRGMMQSIAAKINNDAPEQIASWLAGDPAVWLALLTRPDASTRRTAAGQLAAILGGPIPVDPLADPASQKKEFERLSAQIEVLHAPEKK